MGEMMTTASQSLIHGMFVSFKPWYLNNEWYEFESTSGCDGLATVTSERNNRGNEMKKLTILAVAAKNEGNGQFRQFISDVKQHFDAVVVFEVWNPIVSSALVRYGFKPYDEPDTFAWMRKRG